MTMDDRDDVLARRLEARAGRPVGEDQPELSGGDSDEVESLLDVADLLWEAARSAPPLESDPVAAMLGLVPDPGYTLDSAALSRARKSARLKPSELAARLAGRGWEVQAADVFRWENQSAVEVAPALIKAIAEELRTDVDRLTKSRDSTGETEAITAVTRSPRFASLVERWARNQGVSRALAASALTSRMRATVHRGDHPDASQLIQSLDALVTAMEGEISRDEP